MVDSFIKDWTREPRRSISSVVRDTVQPVHLRSRIDDTIYRLRTVQKKLEDSHLRHQHKYKTLFNKCVKAKANKDQMSALMYANESAQVKKIAQSVLSAKLALEQVTLRLETVREFGDVAAEVMPAMATVNAVRGRLAGVMPNVSMQLGLISQSLDGLVMEAGNVTGSTWNTIASGEEAERILLEASTIAEHKLRDGFPNLPSRDAEKGLDF